MPGPFDFDPIGSMGLVYLPSFTSKKINQMIPNVSKYTMDIHGSYGQPEEYEARTFAACLESSRF